MGWFKKKEEEEKPQCKHDVCHECRHLIAKGSGQTVEKEGGGWSWSPDIYCDLHRVPYDRIDYGPCTIGLPENYFKRQPEWKRVNRDGTDYKEPTKTK